MLEGWSGGGQMRRVKAAGDVAEEALWGPVAAQEQEEKRETGAGRKQPSQGGKIAAICNNLSSFAKESLFFHI